jgi:CspA family cold shock protein
VEGSVELKAEENPFHLLGVSSGAQELLHMTVGKIKWFDNKKGFGFIRTNDNPEDIFVHYTNIQGTGFKTLEDGDTVQFELVQGNKGLHAENVVKVTE